MLRYKLRGEPEGEEQSSLPQVCAILAGWKVWVSLWFPLYQSLKAHYFMYSGIIQTILVADGAYSSKSE